MIAVVASLAIALGGLQASPARAQAQPSHVASGIAADTQSFDKIAAEAMQAWKENRDEEALKLFLQGLKVRPDWDEGLWYPGAIYYEKENYREARNMLRHYLARNPEKGAGWALVGMSDYKLREYVHAREDLQRALASGLQGHKELTGPVYYYSALLLTRDERFNDSAALLYQLQDGDEGRIHVDAALEVPLGLNALGYALLPEEIPTDRMDLVRQVGAAVFARFEQRRDEAKKILLQLLKQYPGELGLHFQYGLMLLEDHDAEGAVEMQKVIELSPSNPEPHLSLADYYLNQRQYEKALTNIDEVVTRDSTNPAAYLLKGKILRASGNDSSAITQLEAARKLAPADSRVLWELMRAYEVVGRREDAERIQEEIEKLTYKNGPSK
jgi:tetratricopeptide (TPR) repeat protein